MAHDPRKSIHYQRMVDIIDLLDAEGPMVIEDICDDVGITVAQYRFARYSLPGRLALEDKEKVIPRPVVAEGYVYKLGSAYQTGDVDSDAEPNLQKGASDLLTRIATIYTDVERLIEFVPGRSRVRKLLRKLQKSLDGTLDRAEDVVTDAGAPVSDWAQHVLDRIA